MHRREFISKSVMATLACCYGLNSACSVKKSEVSKTKKNRIGVQLYSVNKELPNDFEGTLKKLSDIGYTRAEAYGYDGRFLGKSLKETSAVLNEYGMQLSGTHCGTPLLPTDIQSAEWDYWRKAADDMQSANGLYLIQSWFPAQNHDELLRLTEQFNKIGAICNASGIKFGYHNHDAELKEMDGQIILDALLQNTDPNLVFFQMDLGHVVNGGGNILEYLRKYPKRFLSWHVSDFKRGDGYCEVGKGDVPYEELFKSIEESGLEDLTVEQETGGDIFASLKTDFDYLIHFPWTKE